MVATEIDAAAFTAVAAVRTAVWLVFHVAQVHGTFTALARAAVYLNIVNEIGFCHFLCWVFGVDVNEK